MINYPVADLNAGDIAALEIDTIKSIGFYKKTHLIRQEKYLFKLVFSVTCM
jgi:hypothetical protein